MYPYGARRIFGQTVRRREPRKFRFHSLFVPSFMLGKFDENHINFPYIYRHLRVDPEYSQSFAHVRERPGHDVRAIAEKVRLEMNGERPKRWRRRSSDLGMEMFHSRERCSRRRYFPPRKSSAGRGYDRRIFGDDLLPNYWQYLPLSTPGGNCTHDDG